MARASVAELQKQVTQLKGALAAVGIRIREALPTLPEEMPDYVPFGSTAHAALLGLVEVTDPDDLPEGIPTYKSKADDRVWRLIDPVTPYMGMPDPLTQARMVLRKNVHVLDKGEPKVPPDAPEMWTPPISQ